MGAIARRLAPRTPNGSAERSVQRRLRATVQRESGGCGSWCQVQSRLKEEVHGFAAQLKPYLPRPLQFVTCIRYSKYPVSDRGRVSGGPLGEQGSACGISGGSA